MNTVRFAEALTWLVDLYDGDVRKSSGAPAIHHPLGVCELVMGAGGDEDTAIAALFHDFGEDKGGVSMLDEIEQRFGARVARIVKDCSDTLPSDGEDKEPWVMRKVEHIRHIKSIEDDSRMVLAADTLHNTRDHLRGFRANGMEWWKNFRANVYVDRDLTPEITAASTLWYLTAKSFALLKYSENATLAVELNRAVQSFQESLPLDISTTKWSMAEEEIAQKYGDL